MNTFGWVSVAAGAVGLAVAVAGLAIMVSGRNTRGGRQAGDIGLDGVCIGLALTLLVLAPLVPGIVGFLMIGTGGALVAVMLLRRRRRFVAQQPGHDAPLAVTVPGEEDRYVVPGRRYGGFR